jgi:hypothetical protein
MAPPPRSASPPLAYGKLPSLEAGTNLGRPAMVSHSPTNSSINTQESTSPNGIISTNTSSTQSSQTPLVRHKLRQPRRKRTVFKHGWRRRKDLFRERFHLSGNRGNRPRTTMTFPAIVVFAMFLIFLALAVHFPIKLVWVAVMMVGGSLSLGLILACFLEYRKGDALVIPPSIVHFADSKKSKANMHQNSDTQSSLLSWPFHYSQDSTRSPGIHN